MKHTLPKLPYLKTALQPFLSEEAVTVHYEKHHRTYVNKLNKALEGEQKYKDLSLEELISQAPLNGGIFNAASQTWNHTFFWQSVSPNSGHHVLEKSALSKQINDTFGSCEKMLDKFKETALSQFGSGWAWLFKNKTNALDICSTSNAESIIRDNKQPLLICDVWEHAYYIDYQNDRAGYLDAFFDHIDWQFVENNYNAS